MICVEDAWVILLPLAGENGVADGMEKERRQPGNCAG